jgi:hypothetical protein
MGDSHLKIGVRPHHLIRTGGDAITSDTTTMRGGDAEGTRTSPPWLLAFSGARGASRRIKMAPIHWTGATLKPQAQSA